MSKAAISSHTVATPGEQMHHGTATANFVHKSTSPAMKLVNRLENDPFDANDSSSDKQSNLAGPSSLAGLCE